MVLAKRSTAAHRAKVVEEFWASGLKQAEFARSTGIKLGTLQGWIYSRASGRRAPDTVGRFIEVAAPATNAAALVVRVGSTSLELAELPPPTWVADMLTALASR